MPTSLKTVLDLQHHAHAGQEPVQQPQQPEPAQSSNSTALTSAPRGSVPEEDDDEDNSDTTNTVLIAGVLAGTGALILGIGALMTWTCLRRKKTEVRTFSPSNIVRRISRAQYSTTLFHTL